MSKMVLNGLFPAGTRVVSLPSKKTPRLFLMGDTPLKRWRESSLYPAYRSSAKGYRFLLRLKAFSGIGAHSLEHLNDWLIGEFARDIFPKISSLVVLLGTAGPTQKLIIQIWDDMNVIGYLKLAQTQAARIRLEREYVMLTALPKGVGPRVLRFGEMETGKALLMTPVAGKPLSIGLPPLEVVWDFVQSLETSETFSGDSHPWIQRLRLFNSASVDLWVDQLSRHRWPLAYQHGDLAPWNLFATRKDKLVAVDWEYGTVQGFPYVDIIQYCLQVAFLIHRLPPKKAKTLVMRLLAHRVNRFAQHEIEALVNLSVLSTFRQAEQDGHSQYTHQQIWRREVWMS